VTFPPGSLEDESGMPATGTVRVAVTPLDVTWQANAAPGDYTAMAADGSDVRLETLGMVEVDLRDADGAPLNLADGSNATLDFALPDGSAEPGGEVPLWSFDVDTARWVEDGSCTVVEEAGETRCVGDVGHFTWWNCDQVLETTCVEGTIRDCEGAPISGLFGSALTGYAIYDSGTADAVVGDPNGYFYPDGEDLAWTIEADGTQVRITGDITFRVGCAASLARATYELDLTVPVRTTDDPVVDRCRTSFGDDVAELSVGGVGRTDVTVDGTPLVVDLRAVRHVPADDTLRFNLSGLVGGDEASLSFFVIGPESGTQDVQGAQLDLGECDYQATGGNAELTFDPDGPAEPIEGTLDLTFGPLPDAIPPCDTATPVVAGTFTSAVCGGG